MNVIHTSDAEMRRILTTAEAVAPSRATILITGESGTGKELLSRFIHGKSGRAQGRFVAINCAAVPENLLESELFGYEKGAFTGADQRKIGRIELASGGTFLLDEVSELPMILQSKLLRFIQESEIERLGGAAPIKVNVRLIAASNRNLAEMVQKGQFREDLYYRINVIPLRIPPLRERLRDISLLARMFIEASCAENGIPVKELGPDADAKLMRWNWPGNVRELQNTIERSVLLSASRVLAAEDLMIEGYAEQSRRRPELQAGMTVSEAERLLIIKTLEFTGQNRTQAADMLGISIRTLRNKLQEYRSKELL